MLQRTVVNNVKDYVNNQLTAADLSPDGLASSGLIGLAGCDLSTSWLNRLLSDRVTKIKSMQLIGLRRLFGEPVDTIIGTELYKIKNPKRMGGLKRIRWEIGVSRPKTQKDLADRANCSHPIIARIETASYLAVRERWSDISTDAEKIYIGLPPMVTFSVDVLTRLKFSLYINIDDMLGLGDYHDNCREEIVFARGRKENMRFHEADLATLSPQQRKRPELVCSPISYDDPEPEPVPEEEPSREISPELAAMFARNSSRTASQPDSDTLTGFRVGGASNA